MKDYLSIGEVSKMKGVSPKSLRYYEKLGILIPAYINPATGYRYYSTEQLLIVDLILVCITLDIPLKKFREYIVNEANIDIQQLVIDGKKIIEFQIQKLQSSKEFLDKISQHVTRTNRIQKQKQPFIEEIPQRYFLTEEYIGEFSDYKEIDAKYSRLFEQCKILGILDNFNLGILLLPDSDSKKVFVEIPAFHADLENLYIVPAGKYQCETFSPEDLLNLHAGKHLLIVKELLDLKIAIHNPLFEVQRLL